MKGFAGRHCLVAAALCVFLGGCGDPLLGLTEEEENLVITYAAGEVAKANGELGQGLVYFSPEEVDLEEPDLEEPQESEDSTTQDDISQEDTKDPDSQSQEDGEIVQTATLTEALGVGSITAEYRGYDITDSYVEGDYFALSANQGRSYLVLHIDLGNLGDQPVDCNLFSMGIRGTLLVNGTQSATGMTTILLNDFGTFVKTIEPGATESTVMIFETAQEVVADITALSLELQVGESTYHINLE